MINKSNWNRGKDKDIQYFYNKNSKYIRGKHIGKIIDLLGLIDFRLEKLGEKPSKIDKCIFLVNEQTEKYFRKTGRVIIIVDSNSYIPEEFVSLTESIIKVVPVDNIERIFGEEKFYYYRDIDINKCTYTINTNVRL